MLHQFRHLYPQGSLLSELINIDRGLYIVKVSVQNQEIILGTGLAAAETVEKAEDKARERALITLDLTKGSNNEILPLKSPQTVATPTMVTETLATNHTNHNYAPMVETSSPIPPKEAITKPIIESIPEPAPQAITEVIPEPIPEPEEYYPVYEPVEDIPTNIFDQPLAEPPEEVKPPEVADNVIEFDFNDIKHKIDLEMKRLNWTREQGRDYLLSTYGKRSRLHLTDPELLEFLQYLENLPS